MTTDNSFGWNDELPPPKEYQPMPVGDAQFEVLDMQRAHRAYGKLGTCHIADLTLRVVSFAAPDEPQEVECSLALHKKTSWKLYQFFASIGMYKHGDVEAGKPFRPDWPKVIGKCGLCTIKHREWKGKDNKPHVSPDVDDFLDDQGRTRASDQPREVGTPAPAADNLKF